VGFLIALLNVLIVLTSIFLVCLVLIQRGKGGGLAGAFGGMGGSSAFGTKAGDVFTRVTIITAVVWMLMLMVQVILINRTGPVSAYDVTPRSMSEVPIPASAATPPPAGTKGTSPSGTPSSTSLSPAGTPPPGGNEAIPEAPAPGKPGAEK
jgi:preprotein translocase subunit SecG